MVNQGTTIGCGCHCGCEFRFFIEAFVFNVDNADIEVTYDDGTSPPETVNRLNPTSTHLTLTEAPFGGGQTQISITGTFARTGTLDYSHTTDGISSGTIFVDGPAVENLGPRSIWINAAGHPSGVITEVPTTVTEGLHPLDGTMNDSKQSIISCEQLT